MTVEQIIESVKQLSDSEKRAVVEGIVRMLRKSIVASQMAINEKGARSVAEVATSKKISGPQNGIPLLRI